MWILKKKSRIKKVDFIEKLFFKGQNTNKWVCLESPKGKKKAWIFRNIFFSGPSKLQTWKPSEVEFFYPTTSFYILFMFFNATYLWGYSCLTCGGSLSKETSRRSPFFRSTVPLDIFANRRPAKDLLESNILSPPHPFIGVPFNRSLLKHHRNLCKCSRSIEDPEQIYCSQEDFERF